MVDVTITVDEIDYQIIGAHPQFVLNKWKEVKNKKKVIKHWYYDNLIHVLRRIENDVGAEIDFEGIDELLEYERKMLKLVEEFTEAFYKVRKEGKQRFFEPIEESSEDDI